MKTRMMIDSCAFDTNCLRDKPFSCEIHVRTPAIKQLAGMVRPCEFQLFFGVTRFSGKTKEWAALSRPF